MTRRLATERTWTGSSHADIYGETAMYGTLYSSQGRSKWRFGTHFHLPSFLSTNSWRCASAPYLRRNRRLLKLSRRLRHLCLEGCLLGPRPLSSCPHVGC